jgi:hypothetical protein
MTAGDPNNPGIIFGGSGQRQNLAYEPDRAEHAVPLRRRRSRRLDAAARALEADTKALYYASQFIYKSPDSGQTLVEISGDLTRPDPGAPPNLDAAAQEHTDRNGNRGVVYAVSPSPMQAPLIWVGTDDGLIHVTPDDGKSWQT